MLRRDKLCPGGPAECAEAQEEQSGLPCDNCRIAALDVYLASPMGKRFTSVIELDFALRAGFTISMAEVSCVEFGLLRLLDEERHRLEKEELDNIRSKGHGR